MGFVKSRFSIFPRLFSKLRRSYFFWKNNIYVARGSRIAPDVTIGVGTRINMPSHIGSCDIGAYCAIGGRLVVRSSDHHVCYLNMQDWFQREVVGSSIKVSGKSKGRVVIGNNVWIGDSVIILPGVQVGDGAVIGAGSVVTKSIPAYAIAVGNPAKCIKSRFPSDVIEALHGLNWWGWDRAKIRKNRFIFETDLSVIDGQVLRNMLKGVK